MTWLISNMPAGTRATYKQLLDQHNNRFDHEKVAEIFNLYKDYAGALTTGSPGAPLASQVEPNASGVVPVNTPSAELEKIWTRGEIQQAYTDISKGQIGGNADSKEAKQLEKSMDLAFAQGRVKT